MFSGRQYYGLVAGLRHLTLEAADGMRKASGGESGFDAEALYGEIRRELSRRDRRAAGLLWSLADISGLSRPRIEWLYDKCASSGCGFLCRWAEFDRNLRNDIAIQTARGKGWNPENATIGEKEDDRADYAGALSDALDKSNIVEKERAIDLIRWEKADELAEFDTFGIPTILAYLVKVAIIGRWAALDVQTGREMYNKLVVSMGK